MRWMCLHICQGLRHHNGPTEQLREEPDVCSSRTVKMFQTKTVKDQVIGFEQVGISTGIFVREEERWGLELNKWRRMWWRRLVPFGQWWVLIGDRRMGRRWGCEPFTQPQWLAWPRAIRTPADGQHFFWSSLDYFHWGLPTPLGCRSSSLRLLHNPSRFLYSQPSHLQIAFLKTQITLIFPYSLSPAVTQFDEYSSSS